MSDESFWEGVATGILICCVFGAVTYAIALVECCIL